MLRFLLLKDKQAEDASGKEKYLYSLFFLFFIAIYFPPLTWVYNVLMWVIFVYSFSFNRLSDKIKWLLARTDMLLIILFFLFNVISALFSINFKSGLSTVGIRLSLLIFPLSIGSIYISQAFKERVIFLFAFITTVAACGCLLSAIWRLAEYHDLSQLYNDNLSGVINLQSVYFAEMVNIAIISFFWLWSRGVLPSKKLITLFFILILILSNYLLASRTAIFFLYGTGICYALYLIIKRKNTRLGITFLGFFAVALVCLLLFFPKTMNRFRELGYRNYTFSSRAPESHFNVPLTVDQWNGANIRLAIWKNAWSVILRNKIFGTGLGDKGDQLKKEFQRNGFVFAVQTNRNTHNSYLDVWMSLGLLGLIVFLAAFFFIPIKSSYEQWDYFGVLILISFFVALMFENYIDRTIGNTILAFFVSFISSYKTSERSGSRRVITKI